MTPYEAYMLEKTAQARWKTELPNLSDASHARLESVKVETPNGSFTGGINQGLKQPKSIVPALNERLNTFKVQKAQNIQAPAPMPPPPPAAPKLPAVPKPSWMKRIGGKIAGPAIGTAMNVATLGAMVMGPGPSDHMTR